MNTYISIIQSISDRLVNRTRSVILSGICHDATPSYRAVFRISLARECTCDPLVTIFRKDIIFSNICLSIICIRLYLFWFHLSRVHLCISYYISLYFLYVFKRRRLYVRLILISFDIVNFISSGSYRLSLFRRISI